MRNTVKKKKNATHTKEDKRERATKGLFLQPLWDGIYWRCQTEKPKWPVLWSSNGDSSCARVHFTSYAEIQLKCQFILQSVFSTHFDFCSLKKQQQRSWWWNIEMKNDEQFRDISVLHFSARHAQKEIFHAGQGSFARKMQLVGIIWQHSRPILIVQSLGFIFASYFIGRRYW